MDNIVFMSRQFLSTLSLRRATTVNIQCPTAKKNFYPRSPCGERRPARITPAAGRNFYPRSPCGERHPAKSESLTTYLISIHALLAESDGFDPLETIIILAFLSTLSLRRATKSNKLAGPKLVISIHALLAESDHVTQTRSEEINRFLSTLSLRRATS